MTGDIYLFDISKGTYESKSTRIKSGTVIDFRHSGKINKGVLIYDDSRKHWIICNDYIQNATIKYKYGYKYAYHFCSNMRVKSPSYYSCSIVKIHDEEFDMEYHNRMADFHAMLKSKYFLIDRLTGRYYINLGNAKFEFFTYGFPSCCGSTILKLSKRINVKNKKNKLNSLLTDENKHIFKQEINTNTTNNIFIIPKKDTKILVNLFKKLDFKIVNDNCIINKQKHLIFSNSRL